MGLAIGGLGSGLDTTSIVSQLMQAETIPQTTLKTQLSTNTVKAGAWTSLGTIVQAAQTTADGLKTPGQLAATSVTTNAPSQVQVSVSATATPGSVTFRVNRLASAQQLVSGGLASSTAVVGKSSTVLTSGSDAVGATSVTAGGAAITGRHTVVVTGSGADLKVTADGSAATLTTNANGSSSLTLQDGSAVQFAGAPRAGTLSIGLAVTTSDTSTAADLASALASAGGPARAALVDTGDGTATPLRIVLSSTATGAAGAMKVTSTIPALSSATVLQPAQDAELVLGSGAGAVTVHKSSNTISDLLPGATISLTKADPTTDVTVTTAQDDAASTKKVHGLVDDLNAVLGWVKSNTAYDVAKKSGGPMVGEGSVRDLASKLTGAMQAQPATGSLKALGQLGITFQRDGTYAIDDTVLSKALGADPDSVASYVAALATAVSGVTKAANAAGGAVQVGKDSTAASAKDLQGRIDGWTLKLQTIQTRYQKQFSDLDVAMSSMNSQMAALQQQLKSLG